MYMCVYVSMCTGAWEIDIIYNMDPQYISIIFFFVLIMNLP